VYEARAQVGGRVLSDTSFAKGRITEAGAELVGSIHTRWCALAKEYGISLISRMDGGLYRGQQLSQRVILDRLLTPDEVKDIEEQLEARVLRPMAEFARATIPAGAEGAPWTQPALAPLDHESVADALRNRFKVKPTERLWPMIELLLVNDNVARLDRMNFLALLCLIRGGQTERRNKKPVTIADDPLMGYWHELEIYRCGDGCQSLALAIADEIRARKGCGVVRNMGVRRIDLRPAGGGVLVTARTTKDTTFDRWLREKIPGNPLMDTLRYDYVVFAVPPTVWDDIEIVPFHPKDTVGVLTMGPAVKFFSRVKDRFWVRDAFAPMGGSGKIGQVWEGTDNQTRVKGQDTVLSVYTGARTPPAGDYLAGLAELYPADPLRKGSGYAANLLKTLHVDWSRQPYIRAGLSSPALGQVFTVGKDLNEPFPGGLFFAGEHTRMDHFGYMEGAIRSGERAARMLLDQACAPLRRDPVLVAAAG
jgi:monoamine oxidase